MPLTGYFRIRKPDVIYENFEDEVVLINLENGNYYSIQGIAAEIWGWIGNGISINGINEHILHRYQGDKEEIIRSVEHFLDELSQDGLVEAFEPETSAGQDQPVKNAPAGETPVQHPFVPPTLNRYTDMQNLLLLDPIHDVGEQGWPNPQSDISSQSD